MPVGVGAGIGSLFHLYEFRPLRIQMLSKIEAFLGGLVAGLVPGVASLIFLFPLLGTVAFVLFLTAVVMIP